jgi:hypothetical protein
MHNYDVTYDVKESSSISVSALNVEDAKSEALELLKDFYPDHTEIKIGEAIEV